MFRYIGNKSKLTSYILDEIKETIGDSGTVVDLMAGTGTVATYLSKHGYKVIASDVMTYSKCHLIVQLLIKSPPKFEQLKTYLKIIDNNIDMYEFVLKYLNNSSPKEGYFYQEFSPQGQPANGCPSRKYFTSDNAKIIDSIREKINEWIEKKLLTDKEEALLKHNLIMAVNKVANISGTYGYFLSKFSRNSLDKIELVPIEFNGNKKDCHVVLQGYAEELAKDLTADLCYIDPPYMKRQYAANYHILETIARGDFPIAAGKSGLRDWWDQYSNFCSKRKIKDSFRKILLDMNCKNFLISYSEDGLLSVEELVELFSEVGDVTYKKIEYQRFKSNQSNLSKNIIEYIIKIKKH